MIVLLVKSANHNCVFPVLFRQSIIKLHVKNAVLQNHFNCDRILYKCIEVPYFSLSPTQLDTRSELETQ